RNIMVIVRYMRLPFLAIVACTTLASPIRAQNPEEERLRISQKEFDDHVQTLDLSIAQREAAERMFKDYTREFDDARSAFRTMNHWLWTNGSAFNWYGGEMADGFSKRQDREIWQLDEAWQRGARTMESGYFNALRMIA